MATPFFHPGTEPTPSSAPLFTPNPGILTESVGEDPILGYNGANQDLSKVAAKHSDVSTVGPRGNTVQSGALRLLGDHGALGRPDQANPTGRQDG